MRDAEEWEDAYVLAYEYQSTYDNYAEFMASRGFYDTRQMYEPVTAVEAVKEAAETEAQRLRDWLTIATKSRNWNRDKWKEAQTQLQAANAEITALKEAQRWVPVSESLPDAGPTHMITVEAYNGYEALLADFYNEEGTRFRTNCLRCFKDITEDITHWRYITPPTTNQP